MSLDERRKNSDGMLVLTVCVAAAVMFVFPLFVSFPLLDPDEGLHASMTREMVERNEWLTPTLLGEPFFDKPILYFWTQAASVRLFGLSETALRLPGLIFGLLGAVTTGLLAWGLFDRRTGLIATILYSTTILPTALAQAASHDVALIPWINLTLLMLWMAERADVRHVGIAYSVGAGLFLGLAILTKGIFGAAVVGLAYGCHSLLARRLSPMIGLRGYAVLIVAVLIASPWYFLMEQSHPGYLRYYFIDRHLKGFFTLTQPHGDQPWWYYLPFIFGGGLPWIGYLPVIARDRFRNPAMPFLWCWMIGWTVFLFLAGSQLATYLWPIFPPMAILAATAWKRFVDGELGDAARRSLVQTFCTSSWTGPVVLPVAVLIVQEVYDVRFPWPVWVVLGVTAVCSLCPLIPWYAGRRQAALSAAAFSLAGQFMVIMALILPVVAEPSSARLLAEHFNKQGELPARLWIVEGRIGSLIYYLDPQLRRELSPERIQIVLAKELPDFRRGDAMAVQEWKVWKLRKYFAADRTTYKKVGSYRLYEALVRDGNY